MEIGPVGPVDADAFLFSLVIRSLLAVAKVDVEVESEASEEEEEEEEDMEEEGGSEAGSASG